MESISSSVMLDDREEGEIVDDDFEDISDNSIIPMYSGKSVSSKEHLPAISLSSVTEAEEPKREEKLLRRQKSTRRRTSKSYKKRRSSHRKSTCSDSDSDDYLALDKKLQKQLKAAIRVDNVECHRNSLRSRLRAMTKLDNDADFEKNCDNDNKIEEKVSSDEGDSELKQLRIEALRTAVFNKFMHRKKRKVKEMHDDILSDISMKTDTSETNKENTHNTNENVNARLDETAYSKKLCVDKPEENENTENKIEITNNIVESNIPPEDDEDVLRALLLASMSKKITKEPVAKITILPSNSSNRANDKIKQTLDPKTSRNEIKNATVKSMQNFHFKKRVIKNNLILTNNQAVHIPKVKPLIININTDSDTDDDTFNTTIKNASTHARDVKKLNLEIESTVDKFLKEQRAKVEAQSSPIPNPVPDTSVTVNKSVILEKSSVKLLPKVKQIEYQNLVQRIKNAEKRPRIRRTSYKFNSDGKSIGINLKKNIRTKVPVNKQVNNVPRVDQVADVRSDVRTLHKTLKEIQIQKNGRLQIQEKYIVLKPIIKRINEASIERKKYDEDVKRLLEELAELKKKLHKSHQDFTSHIKELIQRKEDVDKSPEIPAVVEDPKTRFTSTPIKEKPPFESFNASTIHSTTPNNTRAPPENVDTSATADFVGTQKEEDIVDVSINPGDPNDIDKIYNIQKNSLPKYISPLDNVKRAVMDDPFSIVCPYDVDGNCRDPECIYKHFFN